MLIQQFRNAVYQSIVKRPDAMLDLLDALTVAGHVVSPVALSEEKPFRRKFSSIFDGLLEGEFDFDRLLESLHTCQPANCECIGGYEVYALDTTPIARPEAETLAERGLLKARPEGVVRYGHKYSWLARLVHPGTSWVAPVDVRRVAIHLTDNQVAVTQVSEEDLRNPRPKVVVADSLYGSHRFLSVFMRVKHTQGLVRLRGTQVFYEHPRPHPTGQPGAPAKHGAKLVLANPARAADRHETFQYGQQKVVLQAWHGLHLKKLPDLSGVVIKAEFFRSDGSPCYQRPLWLFWTGPETLALPDLCRMYRWRFAIEHSFRFMKQHLGLNANHSTQPVSIDHWVWLCALAFWQLLLMREEVEACAPAWYPQAAKRPACNRSPGQVQRLAPGFLVRCGTPAQSPRPAGKGKGRPFGFRPAPRPRFSVVRKGNSPPNRAS
jgi:hypothetical protein